jgi:hypothetical protein
MDELKLPDAATEKDPDQNWLDTVLELLMQEYEPCEKIREADLRMTSHQLLNKIYAGEDIPSGSNQLIYKRLTEKGFKVHPVGMTDDLDLVWLFKRKSKK